MTASRPSLPLTGGRSCGAIRYEIAAFPLLLYTCNCTDCQTASGERKGRPQSMNLRAGTLDDTKWLVPAAHMFMKSAQGWVRPAADAECHEIAPEDFRQLAEKWRAMWPDFFPQK
jgi:hypothetical protein